MRKRAQRKTKYQVEEPKHVIVKEKPRFEKTPVKTKKNWWIAISIISIFFLVLFFNTYFNLTTEVSLNPEGEGFSKFYLSGPDPYYNMRLVEGTYNTGSYPYYSDLDPLLDYPTGAGGGRAPLFNMMALGFSRFLTPFMNEVDAIGYSMQFVPALFGALLIFPVYFIGKELFNKKAAIIGALFVAIIPIHLGSGHGSAYALFDHDSFNLLLFFLTFLFLLKSIKEKDSTKSTLYAIIGGIPLAALTMTWVEARFLYVIIAIYAIVQMIIDIYSNKIELRVFRTTAILLFTGYLVSLPITLAKSGFSLNIPLFLSITVTAFGVVYYLFGIRKIPWTLSLPTIFSIGAIGLVFLYFIEYFKNYLPFISPLEKLSVTIFGSGIYGNKVSMTIAEANTYEISHTVMSFGPSLYWLAWGGLIFLMYTYYKNRDRRDFLFIIMLFILNIWLAGTAGRFLNDMVPLIALLGGWIIWIFVEWIDYKQMLRNIKSAGGGFHGLRRGIKFLHIFGIIFIIFLIILPSTFVAFDAAIPNTGKQKDDGTWTTLKEYMFGEDHRGAYGLGVGKERYWGNAFEWLNNQDTEIEDPTQRPAFISWWDYGFYCVALSGHPTVADNFQDGIPPAANFHTATGEKEGVIVLLIRLLDGDKFYNQGKLSEDVKDVIRKHTGENNSEKIIYWIENPTKSPSFGTPIGEEYDENTSKDYTVGQQYADNAYYHDVVDLLADETTGLTDEEITWLYHDLQEVTGFSIRYYGVEGYDRQIFNIFGFLSDKSILLINGIEDDFVELIYNGYTVDENGNKIADRTWAAQEIIDMDMDERRQVVVTGTSKKFKEAYFETMFYRTYIGPPKDLPDGGQTEYDWQVPCENMKHFYAEYISDLSRYPYYDTGRAAVVIAKYYEGAKINGSVNFNGDRINIPVQVVVRKPLSYTPDYSFPIIHDSLLIDGTDENTTGDFELIAGAGANIAIVRNLELYNPTFNTQAFVIKELNFTGPEDSNLAPITDDDAMRKSTNYERFLNITIDPASAEGFVYSDIDGDGAFNKSIDEPVENANVVFYEVLEFDTTQLQSNRLIPVVEQTPFREVAVTNESGYYNVSGLMPGYYAINTYIDEIPIGQDIIDFYSGNNTYDVIKPKNSAVEGTVYFDIDRNGELNSGDEIIDNATVQLIYTSLLTDENITIDNVTTGSDGVYSFTDIIPGQYMLRAFDYPDYLAEETINLRENETLSYNISMGFFAAIANGVVTHKHVPVRDITINFDRDESYENNTAEARTKTSDENGLYDVDLMPGYYNVSVQHLDGQILVFSFTDQINVSKGEIAKEYNIALTKQSVTVSGYTSYDGTNIANVTNIRFEPSEIDIANNTALFGNIANSNETGFYRLELSPGSYEVSIDYSTSENDKNFTYKYKGPLEIDSTDIDMGVSYNIAMVREEKD